MANFDLELARAYGSNIIVKFDKQSDKLSASGLNLSLKPAEENIVITAKVISTGNDARGTVAIGDTVIFQRVRLNYVQEQQFNTFGILPSEHILAYYKEGELRG